MMRDQWAQLAVFRSAEMNESVMKHEAENCELTLEEADYIVKMAKKRAELMERLAAALQANDDAGALRWAREVCGLPTEVKPQ